ncbi:DUF2892 domain-containing protein [Fibrisoma montanum]|uniref:DUF2892 domain-containing protein n=1 Tax=Fibrisoma montanum TaxID=2305895 RepID=A0A418M8I7_9BACT|nr:SRPBCC family protein [Fibrisoma montanum]RIV22399.1 DUF2892 domain-containing protein [Fibrisoma montanum]
MARTANLAQAGVLDIAPVDPIPSGSSKINVGQNERWLSVGAGLLVANIGIRRGGIGGVLLTALGATLALRGASGYCPINDALGRDTSDDKTETNVLEISKSVTINKPREEVYQFWRKLENLPQFMRHLEDVKQTDERRSHWVARLDSENIAAKALPKVEWDADIVEEEENSRLVWRSVPGATIDNSGEVRFVDAPGNRGTEVHATIKYRPPQGIVGEAVLKLLNPAFKQMVKEDIRRFKRLMETGEIPTNEGPSGRKPETINPALRQPIQNTQTTPQQDTPQSQTKPSITDESIVL